MKKIISAIAMMAVALTSSAQSGTNSPYSQYGLGVLSDQTSGFNRGMNGLGQGFRMGNQVNFINPASYSAVDSLTFLFDVGMSAQLTNFSENGVKKNAKNADFEYAVAAFRAFKHVGMSFGVVPFTSVGYSYYSSDFLDNTHTVYYSNTYSGSGGLHQLYVGAGWEPVKGLSVGANASYLWGDITRSITNAYSDANVSSLAKVYNMSVASYKVDFGVQYQHRVGKNDVLTAGATYSPGHKLGSDPTCTITSGSANSAQLTAEDALELPDMLGAGVSVNHKNLLRVGVDYSLQRWGATKFPEYSVVNDVQHFAPQADYFKDRHKLTLGGEYGKSGFTRGFFDRLRYRAGVSYATPYLKINGKDGPKELSVSAGLGIPIVNRMNNRSIVNVSGQWVRQSGQGMITENTFRINVGITFNESWFNKWKVE